MYKTKFIFILFFKVEGRRSMTPVDWSSGYKSEKKMKILQEGVHNASNNFVDFWVQHVHSIKRSRQEVDALVLKGINDKRFQGYK